MPVRFFIEDTKNEGIILHVAMTGYNRAAHHRHIDTTRKHFLTRKHPHLQTFTLFNMTIQLFTLFKPHSNHFPQGKNVKPSAALKI